ncbi:EAL domain-containing protein [Metabacillus fastidiosus]|uniref:EAL domain-containing protein n=1 Tax=Metabacillus fastidiosus TaxID=1458 RepID=UPI000A9E42A4|nr:EAL domain-containing protein [Metabacillus fastidiosus]MED4461007.1 EAL domain-containing protein [Metabacillus fastidiosus]
MRSLGACSFPFIAAAASMTWLFKPYRKSLGTERTFWFLLIIGVFFYLIANCIWFYMQIIYGVQDHPKMSHLMWLLSYVFFLIALIYKLKVLNKSFFRNPFFYNVLIFMITAAALSIHYLIKPALEFSDNSLLLAILNLSYQLINLCLLFMIINIFYYSQYMRMKKVLLVISIGFLAQFTADSIYSYLLIGGKYHTGSLMDPLWGLSILIIGLSSLYTSAVKEEINWKQDYNVKNSGSLFPYITVIALIIIVINSEQWHWNALVIGLIVTFLLVIMMQILVIKKNSSLANEFWYYAYHDELTGLHNRVSFQRDLIKILDDADILNRRAAILLLDLDRFKNINDTFGHHIGDLLLKECARKLKEFTGNNDRVYRVGGDEFIIILSNATEQDCINTAETILNVFTKSLFVEEYEISITPSIGISLYPENGVNNETLLKYADMSMYLAKSKGRNNFQFYSSELNETLLRTLEIENELKKAIKNDDFTLYYQPKVNLKTREIVGMEALLRWNNSRLGFVSPAEFIPIAEETGQIVAIGEWVLKTACKQMKEWQRAGFTSLRMSVNVSVFQFQHSDFIMTVKTALEENELDAKYLEVEITESIMQNIVDSMRILNELKSIGVKTSIDDFGTGYSSLSVLKKLPIDAIKIDKSFVDDVADKKDKSLVNAIIDIGVNLNLEVVVEGIEYEDQVSHLSINNCILGQGYLFSKPVPASDFEKIFMNN